MLLFSLYSKAQYARVELTKQYNIVTTINTKQLNKGIYIVKVLMVNGEVKVEKLLVE